MVLIGLLSKEVFESVVQLVQLRGGLGMSGNKFEYFNSNWLGPRFTEFMDFDQLLP